MTPIAKIMLADSRSMIEVEAESVDLVVTSPPYWQIKDYGTTGQVGYGQTLHDYLGDLYHVWLECFRVLRPGSRMCINVGDQFARAAVYGRYKVIPLHAEIIAQAERIGFDYMGSIIWQKKTTMNTTGGATVMGSFPHPPNGIVEIDYEHILLFKKPGKPRKVSSEIKEQSKLTTEEWKTFFAGHWNFAGARQVGHEAMFPPELPRRLIRMFSFVGDTVLDPFLGSGTTAQVALELNRNVFGFEINPQFQSLVSERLLAQGSGANLFPARIEWLERAQSPQLAPVTNYEPSIADASPVSDSQESGRREDPLFRVVEADDHSIRLDSGLTVEFLGVEIRQGSRTAAYLKDYLVGRKVSLDFDTTLEHTKRRASAYVHLKNRIFVNAYLIRSGLADADRSRRHRLSTRFEALQRERDLNGEGMGSEHGHEPVGAQQEEAVSSSSTTTRLHIGEGAWHDCVMM